MKRHGDSWVALCPAHPDRQPSLSVSDGDDGKALLHCHAGCSLEAVLAALNIPLSALQPDAAANRARLVARYGYHDEHDQLLYEVLRWEPKGFSMRPASGNTGRGAMKNVPRVLYRLPEVIAAVRDGRRVWVTEGEKDADALVAAGEVATCNPGGAGKWQGQYAEYLAYAEVMLVADRDEAGRRHALHVLTSLSGIASSVTVVEAATGKDASDHLIAGLAVKEFRLVDVSTLDSIPLFKGVERKEASSELRFLPISELIATTPPEPDWIVEGLIATGAITLLAGKPKVGKSTLVSAALRAIEVGGLFLGLGTRRTKALLLTEERPATLVEKARIWGLGDGVHVLMWHKARGKSWADVVHSTVSHAVGNGFELLIVDPWDKWVGLAGDAENSAGVAVGALASLLEAAGDGLAVLVVAHQRKAPGEYGDAVRGSSALAGGVDVIAELERPPNGNDANARVLKVQSRFDSALPDAMLLRRDDASYISEGAPRGGRERIGELRKLLDREGTSTAAEVARSLGMSQSGAHRMLQALVDDGEASRNGGGVKGDPYRFSPASVPSLPDPLLKEKEEPSDDAEWAILGELGVLQQNSYPACRYAEHRETHWVGVGGRRICGVCHPPAGTEVMHP